MARKLWGELTRPSGEIDAWRRRVESQKLPADTEVASGMSPEQVQQLRSLGYIK
jgi:hypothetical protein